MHGGSEHCTGGSDQNHPKEKEMLKGQMVCEETLQIAEKRREAKGKGVNGKYAHLKVESQEQKEEIRKPSSVNNAKKQRKRIEWERLEISSRKLEILRESFMQRWAQ